MELAILLSLAASVCTATSSVCQRLGARHLERCGEMRGSDALLVFRLARQPKWLLGFACMIAGFAPRHLPGLAGRAKQRTGN
jgi:hypothetical protein